MTQNIVALRKTWTLRNGLVVPDAIHKVYSQTYYAKPKVSFRVGPGTYATLQDADDDTKPPLEVGSIDLPVNFYSTTPIANAIYTAMMLLPTSPWFGAEPIYEVLP